MKRERGGGGRVRWWWGVLALAVVVRVPAAVGQEVEKKEQEKKGEAKPAAGVEGFKWGFYEGHGEVEVGYRAVTEVGGNREMYRSMVNLGEGVKLLRTSLTLRSNYGSGGLFDHLEFSANNWGGDPYNTARFGMGRTGVYELRVEYRNLNYYNFIPGFANPLLGRGRQLGQHSLNVTHRTTDVEFRLTASRKVQPYIGYGRGTGFGPGYTTYSETGNEYLLRTRWAYAADEYRGGVQFELPRVALTVENGLRFLKNDTGVTEAVGRDGNGVGRTFLGEPLYLTGLSRGYHDRVRIPFTKGYVKAVPFESLSVSGRYVYSSADLEGGMGESSAGNIVRLEDRVVFQSAQEALQGRARKPSHAGAFTVEYEPFGRVRFLDQFETRSFHVSGSAVLGAVYFGARPLANPAEAGVEVKVRRALESVLAYDEVRNQGEVEVEVARGLAVRGGLRYTYAEARLEDRDGLGEDRRGKDITQHTGLFGVRYRPAKWLQVAAEYENNEPGGVLTRTDLLDYDQVKVDWRVGAWKKMSVNGRVAVLRNRNVQQEIDLEGHNRNYAVGFDYEGERVSLSLDYTRSNMYSNLAILLPSTFELGRSVFDERGHGVGGMVGIGLARGTRLELGYRGTMNTGEYPLNYHQPYASLSIPLKDRMVFRTQWQYFGYNEKGASVQDYRTHLVTLGLAYSR